MKRVLVSVLVFNLSMALAWAQAPRGAQGAAPGGARGAQGAPGAAPGAQTAPAARGGGRGGAGRIVSFEATPAAIKPGESFILSWQTQGGAGTIDNGIGATAPTGTIKVTPKATTTYTLSMANGSVTRSVTVTVAGTTPVAATNTPAGPRPIPLVDGKPDFSGIYGSSGFPARGNATQGPASPFDKLPTQPTLKPGSANRGGPANPSGGTSDCLPLPADSAFGVPYPFQIIQNKNFIIFFNEYPGTFRIIPLDGTPHPADPDPTWMGDSIGSWDGDTLVIDTVGYNGKHAIGGIQKPSEKFHTIERLTRTSATAFAYEIVYEDSEFATGQWRATRAFNADTRVGVNKIGEFVCENNRDYTPLFGPGGPQQGGGGGGAGGGRGGRGGGGN